MALRNKRSAPHHRRSKSQMANSPHVRLDSPDRGRSREPAHRSALPEEAMVRAAGALELIRAGDVGTVRAAPVEGDGERLGAGWALSHPITAFSGKKSRTVLR